MIQQSDSATNEVSNLTKFPGNLSEPRWSIFSSYQPNREVSNSLWAFLVWELCWLYKAHFPSHMCHRKSYLRTTRRSISVSKGDSFRVKVRTLVDPLTKDPHFCSHPLSANSDAEHTTLTEGYIPLSILRDSESLPMAAREWGSTLPQLLLCPSGRWACENQEEILQTGRMVL